MRGATHCTSAVRPFWSFQSTRPMRGATRSSWLRRSLAEDFNPRAPCGARRNRENSEAVLQRFQSTRPMRGATYSTALRETDKEFQSTRPMRGATGKTWQYRHDTVISIHAPHAGRDDTGDGEDHEHKEFQSTRPMRGATAKVYKITLHTFATKGNS